MIKLDRTKENPWILNTPPGTSEYTMHIEEKNGIPGLLFVQLGVPCSCMMLAALMTYIPCSGKQAIGLSWVVRTSKNLPRKERLKPGEGHQPTR